MNWRRWIGPVTIALIATLFAYLNAGERIAINLGFAYLYRLPLTGVIFTAFLLGMIAMFLLGLRHDLRVRRALQHLSPPPPLPEWRPDPPPDLPP